MGDERRTKYISCLVIYSWKCFIHEVFLCLGSWKSVLVITIPRAQVLRRVLGCRFIAQNNSKLFRDVVLNYVSHVTM